MAMRGPVLIKRTARTRLLTFGSPDRQRKNHRHQGKSYYGLGESTGLRGLID